MCLLQSAPEKFQVGKADGGELIKHPQIAPAIQGLVSGNRFHDEKRDTLLDQLAELTVLSRGRILE